MEMKILTKKQSKFIQGECKIDIFDPLKINYLKSFTLGLLMVVSMVGLILLYNSKKLRKFVFYSQCQRNQAQYFYISTQQGNDDIQKVQYLNQQNKRFFIFKKLRYWFHQNDYNPIHFDQQFKDNFKKQNLSLWKASGLNDNQVLKLREVFGLNEHTVDIPNYFSYMVSVIFTPLYLLQYIVVIILSLQGLPLMGIILILVSLITTSGNYIAFYISNKKIKQIAQKSHKIKVQRNNSITQIESKQIVPGDIIFIQPQNQICCDAILVTGNTFMNECSLTGQSVPIGKFSTFSENLSQLNQINWLYEGTKCLQAAHSSKAMVIYTGFSTRKGRILRQILNRIPQQPDFFNKAVILLILSGFIAIILYFCTVKIKLDSNIDRPLVWLGLINFLLNAIPPAFPIYFTMAYSWSIYRLRKIDILTTMPEKTVQANRLKIQCFDKTGTLTQNSLMLNKIFVFDKQFVSLQNFTSNSPLFKLVNAIFGTCHSVRKINGEFLGDQIDLKMFKYSKMKKTQNQKDKDIYFSQFGQTYQIIKLHQFQSKFQSMSVLVHDKKSNKYYCFSKGAPQKIINSVVNKIIGYDKFVSDLALNGLRTIAICYKQISITQVQTYINSNRQIYLQKSQFIGLVTFENQLKLDAAQTINILKNAQIDCKMITGDGIYIAIQTAMRAKIFNQDQKIFVIEGKKQTISDNKYKRQRTIRGTLLKKTQTGYTQQQIQVQENKLYQLQKVSLAIDNEAFSKMDLPASLICKIKIFARIVPQNKAKIVKSIKQQLIDQMESLSFSEKLFNSGIYKVGMAGDGANDLLAIKQADVGIGISNTDASYGAAFTIQQLDNIIMIVKQGKSTTQNIVQNLRYCLIVNYLNIIADILCSTQSTFLSLMMALFLNFFMITTLPIISALSKPDPQDNLTPKCVQDNFMNLKNHLLTWGNILILGSGLIGGFFYIRTSEGYQPNPNPFFQIGKGYNPQCQLVTAIFLLIGLPLTSSCILVYQSLPWKNPFYSNIILTVMIVLNIIIMLVFYFANNVIAGTFGIVKLPLIKCLILLVISLSSQILAFGYTYVIRRIYQNNERIVSGQRNELNQTKSDLILGHQAEI